MTLAKTTLVKTKRVNPLDLLLAAVLIVCGLTVCGISLEELAARGELISSRNISRQKMAQVVAPQPDVPVITPGKDNGPAESKPGGTRPTTPAPEPARPDVDAQKAGAVPALPAAPAEKVGEPLPERK